MLLIIISLLLAYLLGSIPSGLIIGKTFYKIDIREHGSKNLGATNSFRVLGFKPGLTVTLMDILKGTFATLLPGLLGADIHPLIVGVVAVIGHMFPIFANFKGGKAVATSAGVVLAYQPLLFVLAILFFFITLYISKYVSLSSMIAALASLMYCLIFRFNDWSLITVILILTIFIFYRHRANIKRIIEKTEPKIKWL